MGHFFRALNFIAYLQKINQFFILLLNEHQPSIKILRAKSIPFEIISLGDLETGWEEKVISRYQITVWLNDRLDTHISHAERVKSTGIKLVTFDDQGSGANISDLHFAPLFFDERKKLTGNKIYQDISYLILNPEISKFKKRRYQQKKILVTMGGSDTYGVTIKVVKQLKKLGKSATILLGPSFEHIEELKKVITPSFNLIESVSSLIKTFSLYDLAITGGGITPFEANASGLPCIVVANELFEIPAGHYLEKVGSSLYAGFHDNLDNELFTKSLDISKMSQIGFNYFTLQGSENVYREITSS